MWLGLAGCAWMLESQVAGALVSLAVGLVRPKRFVALHRDYLADHVPPHRLHMQAVPALQRPHLAGQADTHW